MLIPGPTPVQAQHDAALVRGNPANSAWPPTSTGALTSNQNPTVDGIPEFPYPVKTMCECLEYEDGSLYLCPPCADIHRELLANTRETKDDPQEIISPPEPPGPWDEDEDEEETA